jgi:hypothetical protein
MAGEAEKLANRCWARTARPHITTRDTQASPSGTRIVDGANRTVPSAATAVARRQTAR